MELVELVGLLDPRERLEVVEARGLVGQQAQQEPGTPVPQELLEAREHQEPQEVADQQALLDPAEQPGLVGQVVQLEQVARVELLELQEQGTLGLVEAQERVGRPELLEAVEAQAPQELVGRVELLEAAE